jgi:hypothetical protein
MREARRFEQAMKSGLERAGFVNVRARSQDDRDGVFTVTALADCPCGLGTSSMSQRFAPSTFKLASVERLAKATEDYAFEIGIRHIEEDRAAGRWSDG